MGSADDTITIVEPAQTEKTDRKGIATIIAVQIVRTVVHMSVQVNITEPGSEGHYVLYN